MCEQKQEVHGKIDVLIQSIDRLAAAMSAAAPAVHAVRHKIEFDEGVAVAISRPGSRSAKAAGSEFGMKRRLTR